MKNPVIQALRPSHEPHPMLPFSARSVYSTNMQPEKHDVNPPKKMVQIYWCISGNAIFKLGDTEWQLTPNHTCCYNQMVSHDIKAGRDGCLFYYWTFDGPLANDVLTNSPFQNSKTIEAGPPPIEKLLLLESYIKDYSHTANALASSLVYQLTMLSSVNSQANISQQGFVYSSIAYMKESFHDIELNIEAIARKYNITRNHFCREFTRQQGLSPSSYLKKLRIQNALQSLSHTNLTIAEISRKSGFADPNYFSRVLQKELGLSPSEYREENQV